MVAVANVRDFGATGDGTTDDGDAIIATRDSLVAGGGGQILFPFDEVSGDNDFKITTSITFDETFILGFHDGTRVTGTGTLILDDPSKLQTFITSPPIENTVTLEFTHPGVIHPEWFGAVGDGLTDDRPSLILANICAHGCEGVIELRHSAVYRINNNMSFSADVGFIGYGKLQPASGFQVVISGPLHLLNKDIFDESDGGSFGLIGLTESYGFASKRQEVFSSGGTVNVYLHRGHYAYHLLTENTQIVPLNKVDGGIFMIRLEQPAGQSFTVTFSPSFFKMNSFTMSPGTGVSVTDTLTFVYDSELTRYVELARTQGI